MTDPKLVAVIRTSDDDPDLPNKDELFRTFSTYRKIRAVIGTLGLALPLLLVILEPLVEWVHQRWNGVEDSVPQFLPIETSMSAYYYTKIGGLFVGSLFAIGLLLLSYNYRKWDTRFTNAACVFAIVVALCPTPEDGAKNALAYLHYGGAALLFVSLAIMAFFRFPLTHTSNLEPTDSNQKNRNQFYQACGLVIFSSIVLALILWYLENFQASQLWAYWLFVLEAVMVFAFGLSWLVKGGFYLGLAFLQPDYSQPGEVLPIGVQIDSPGTEDVLQVATGPTMDPRLPGVTLVAG